MTGTLLEIFKDELINEPNPLQMKTENLLSIKEYADALGVERSYVYRLIEPQKIEPVRIGNHLFIDTEKYPIKKFKKK